MDLLVIETASEACSVALFARAELIAGNHDRIGRGHAESLVPMIAALPGRGKAARIAVSRGPGSFTGVRVGLAAARALAYAWQAELVGYPTLALVAAMARSGEDICVCMHGGHGEWFVQQFGADGLPDGDAASLSPEAAARQMAASRVAGNRAAELVALRGYGEALDLVPDARAFLSLPGHLAIPDTAPIYGRAPDAKVRA